LAQRDYHVNKAERTDTPGKLKPVL